MKENRIFYILIIILFLVLIGISFAVFRTILKSNDEIVAEVPMIKFSYIEPDYSISSQRMSDEVGKAQDNFYEFTIFIDTKNNMKLNYYLYASEIEGNNIKSEHMKVYLTDSTDRPVGRFKDVNASLDLNFLDKKNSENLTNVIDQMCVEIRNGNFKDCGGSLDVSGEMKYRLRYWISDDFDIKPNVLNENNIHTVLSDNYIYKFKLNVLVTE